MKYAILYSQKQLKAENNALRNELSKLPLNSSTNGHAAKLKKVNNKKN